MMPSVDEVKVNEVLLSTVSLAASSTIMEEAKPKEDLARMQDQLTGDILDAQDVLLYIKTIPPRDVNKVTASLIDRSLKHLGVKSFDQDVEAVAGLEHLGYELSPQRYLETRIAGLESFIGDAFRYTKRMMSTLAANTSDIYTIMLESDNSLKRRVTDLEQRIKQGVVFEEGKVECPLRYFRRLSLDGNIKVKDLPDEIKRMSSTIKGIISNYQLYANNQSNELMSYFSRLAEYDEEKAIERLGELPKALNKQNFKDAMYLDRELSTDQVVVKTTVKFLGDRYFISKELKNRNSVKGLQEVKAYVESYVTNTLIELERTKYAKAMIGKEEGNTSIPSLKSKDANRVLSEVIKSLKVNADLFDASERTRLTYKDYQDILQVIDDAEWCDEFKLTVHALFDRLIIRLNNEGNRLLSETIPVLTLTLNAAVSLVELNITD